MGAPGGAELRACRSVWVWEVATPSSSSSVSVSLWHCSTGEAMAVANPALGNSLPQDSAEAELPGLGMWLAKDTSMGLISQVRGSEETSPRGTYSTTAH